MGVTVTALLPEAMAKSKLTPVIAFLYNQGILAVTTTMGHNGCSIAASHVHVVLSLFVAETDEADNWHV